MKTHDTLGRQLRGSIRPLNTDFTLTERDREILKFLLVHHDASVPFLFERTKHICVSYEMCVRRMQKLNENGYVYNHPAQMEAEYPNSNYRVWRITPNARVYLADLGFETDHYAVGGSTWKHNYGTNIVTASIEIHSRKSAGRVLYYPQKHAEKRIGRPLVATVEGKNLKPDAYFLLHYANGDRLFAVEFDRATEQVSTSGKARKTYAQTIWKYRQFIGKGMYKEQFGIDFGMLALFVFSKPSGERGLHREIAKQAPDGNSYILTKTIKGIDPFKPTPDVPDLFTTPWNRYGLPPLFIDR